MHLADDLIVILLAVTDGIEDFAGRHGDLGGVDAVWTKHRATAAFGTLVKVVVPFVQHFAGQISGTHQFGEYLARQCEITAVYAAHQILPRNRHVFRILRADEIMTFIRACSAMYAAIHVHRERAVFAEQFTHLGYRLIMPVVNQLAGKSQRPLNLVVGDIRPTTFHGPRLQSRNNRNDAIWGCCDRSAHLDSNFLAQPEMCRLSRGLSAWLRPGEKNNPGACNSLLIGKIINSTATRDRCT